MNQAQNIPWRRVTVEAAAIVASILLAFAIDAWWDERQDRKEETRTLHALKAEFEVNARRLAYYVRSHEITVASANELIGALREADEDNPAAVQDSDILNVTIHLTFDPNSGAFDAMLQSGALRLIQNPAIREQLAAWPSEVSDATENERMLRTLTGPKLADVLMQQVDFVLIHELFECRDESTMKVCSKNKISLRPSLDLVGNLVVVRAWANQAAIELKSAEQVAREIIRQFNEELANR